ncbi:MAG: hypothetical protein K1X57_08145 [Gemmataceae bacterium]|nr:hypothetical protein [Gemmataceae bacterium]
MSDGRPQRDWRAGGTAPAGGGGQSKANIFVAGLLAVALAGVLAGFGYWLVSGGESTVRYIALPLSEHSHPAWPAVPYAEADAERLLKHFPGGEKAFNNQEEELFSRKLDSLKSLGDRPLVLHISALCVVHEGKPYLLSSKAAPGTPDKNWHPLSDLLAAVAACQAKEKLLILDVIHPVARADRGILADTSAIAVHGLLKSRADEGKLPGLVLVSCSPGEFPLMDETYRTTAFAGYLDEGLRGYADGHIEGTRDRWVKVRELHAYTRDRLAKWAYFTRGVTQTVALYGEGDFRLVPHDRVQEAETPPAVLPYPAWLAEGWTQRDEWDAAGLREKAPHLVARYDDALLKAESRYLAGLADEKVKRELNDTRSGLNQSWDRFKGIAPPPKTNLVGTPPPVGVLGKIEGWLASFDGKKKFADVAGDPKPKPDEILLAAWIRLADTPLPRDQVAGLCGEAVPPGSRPESSEAVFLSKLTDLAGKRPFVGGDRTWPGQAVQAAIKGEQATLEAVAMLATVPSAFPWFKARLDKHDKDRLAAEELLWSLGNDGLTGAASAANETMTRYRAIENQAGEIRDDARRIAIAHRAWVDAGAELPGLGAAIAPLPAGGAMQQWNRAANGAAEIASGLSQLEMPGDRGEQMANTAAAVNDALKSLRAHVASLVAREPDGKVTPAVLATPRLTGKDRLAWLQKRTTAIAANEKKLSDSVGDVPAAGEWAGPEAERAAVRGQVAVGLLSMAGQSTGPMSSEVADLVAKRDPFGWSGLAGRVLTALAPPAQDALTSVTDRTGRVFGTTDAPARMSARLRREFWTALAERYEGEARSRGLAELRFYKQAAQDARAAADVARTAMGS